QQQSNQGKTTTSKVIQQQSKVSKVRKALLTQGYQLTQVTLVNTGVSLTQGQASKASVTKIIDISVEGGQIYALTTQTTILMSLCCCGIILERTNRATSWILWHNNISQTRTDQADPIFVFLMIL
ncbi:hypothetical protein ACJX0J_016078, partial [Zea mays]